MIYPKNFALTHKTVESETCFMLMPFSEEFNIIYGKIKSFLKKMGIKCSRADDIFDSGPILSTVLEHILRSEFVIADLTSRNPNVFYEVGFAHSFRDSDCVILIAQSIEDIPFDIRHLPILIYDPDNLYLLEDGLKNRILTSQRKIGQKRFLLDHFSDSDIPTKVVEKTIDTIKSRNRQFVEDLHILLSDGSEKDSLGIQHSQMRTFVEELDSYSVLADGSTRKLLYKIKLEVLTRISKIEGMSEYCISFLKDSSRNVMEYSFRDDLMFSADFACKLIDDNLHKSIATNWILSYLLNSRVGGIDIIRNRIDEFLVNTAQKDVDKALINEITSDNDTLREAVVDILTQKKNQEAYSHIITALEHEKNIYVVRSIINGLARYDNPSAMEAVNRWFRGNVQLVKIHRANFLVDSGIEFFNLFEAFHYSEELAKLSLDLS